MDEDLDIGSIRFDGALLTSIILKSAGVVVLIGGAIGTAGGAIDYSTVTGGRSATEFVLFGALATVVSASVLFFLGYALEIAVASYTELWRIRFNTAPDDE